MLRWHRLFAFLAAPFLLYVIATGAGIEVSDMIALLGHAPETGPEMRTMREHIYGPPNYAVVSATDYAAPALPADLDITRQILRTAALGQAAMPGASLRLVELRTYQGQLAGHVRMDQSDLAFDLGTGRRLPDAALPWPQPPAGMAAPRVSFKKWHRLGQLGFLGATLNLIVGLALSAMIVTGLVQYFKLYRMRRKLRRASPFWSGGSWWRVLHRGVSIVAVAPVIWLVASGLALSIDNITPGILGIPQAPGQPDALSGDFSSPLRDEALPGMVKATLAGFAAQHPDTGIKVIRLRTFAGYPQGVIIAADAATAQDVYDTRSGAALSMNEPGYPRLAFPSGWEWHQRLKRIHRGDIFGMPGRWLASFAALSLLYLIVSGSVMYFQLWRRRSASGRPDMIWK